MFATNRGLTNSSFARPCPRFCGVGSGPVARTRRGCCSRLNPAKSGTAAARTPGQVRNTVMHYGRKRTRIRSDCTRSSPRCTAKRSMIGSGSRGQLFFPLSDLRPTIPRQIRSFNGKRYLRLPPGSSPAEIPNPRLKRPWAFDPSALYATLVACSLQSRYASGPSLPGWTAGKADSETNIKAAGSGMMTG